MKRVGFQRQLAPGFFDGHGVAIGLIGDLTVAIEMHRPGDTTVEGPPGQGAQQRLLVFSSSKEATRGMGTRKFRRLNPTDPSTPPFSCP
jgi:hypothetical protein